MNRVMTLLILSVFSMVLSAQENAYSYQYATVLSVKPIVEIVKDYQPREVCFEQEVTRKSERSSSSAKLVGGIVGAVVGSKLGHKGSGKVAGAAAGAIIGSAIGAEASKKEKYNTGVETYCETRNEMTEFERTAGFRVVYRYLGKNYTTELPYHPGNELKLRVEFEPVIDNP